MKKIVLLFLFLAVLANTAGAFYNIVGKKIAFFVDERSGEFYAENPNPVNANLRMLLFKDQPPTSYITLILDNKTYRLSDTKLIPNRQPDYLDNTIRIYYKADQFQVTVSYLLTNLGGAENDSVVCGLSIKNTGKNQTTAGARFLFDTIYDEANRKVMLYFPSGERIDYDRMLSGDSVPQFVYSGPYDADRGPVGGLFVYPFINSIRPESLIIGNWKKLDEKELSYTVEPLAKFKYNAFSNPDAAVAVLYKNVPIRPGEEVSFGAALSTSKVTPTNLMEPVVSVPAPLPVSAGINTNTNILQPLSLPSPTVPVPTGDLSLLKAQLDLLAKASVLLDKITTMMQTNQTNGITQSREVSSLGRGLERAVTISAEGDPFETAEPLPAPVVSAKKEARTVVTNVIPQPTVQQSIYSNLIYNTVQNTVTDQKELNNVKNEMSAMQKQYEDKITSLQDYYQKLMKQQEEEFKNLSSDYKKKMEEKDFKKSRTQKLDEVNGELTKIDKKIDVIGKLMDLNVDFKTLPPEKLSEIEKLIQDLEQRLK